jgi:hypothetical protein
MKCVTKIYLVEIIYRMIDEQIGVHRMARKQPSLLPNDAPPTGEEVLDFIISIPFFDNRLKDFLIGNVPDHAILISANWEQLFIEGTANWCNSAEWLLEEDETENVMGTYAEPRMAQCLGLPY